MTGKITPPLRLMLDSPAWQSEVLKMRAPAIACGALLLLKMHLWRIGPIPDDDIALTRITATSPAEWKKLRKTLETLFIVKYGEWQREDWNGELEASYEAVNKASRAGKKANQARWGKLKSASESLQRVRQVPPVSSQLFVERTAKMSIAQGKRTGVEERVQQRLVESVDDGSDCADDARCGLLSWPATELARPVPVRG